MESLPEEALKHIFRYSGDARALLSCERSCSTFKTILEDDELWRDSCGNMADRTLGASYREQAFIDTILDEIREEQKRSGQENAILSVLAPELIRRIINRYIVRRFNNRNPSSNIMSFDIRGDTLRCLLDMVEDYMVQKYKMASLISIRASTNGNGEYPAVLIDDMKIVERCQATWFCEKIVMGEPASIIDEGITLRNVLSEAMDREFDANARFQLARRLANRAGVVKMTSEVMNEVAIDIFMVLANLLWRPMLIHRDILIDAPTAFEYDSIDLWEDIPPAMQRVDNGRIKHSFVIVAGQIEESASELGITNGSNSNRSGTEGKFKEYGEHIWALSVGQTLEVAIKTAKRRYMVAQRKMDDDDLLSLHDNDEYGSLSDSDVESIFSEHDDCPDFASSSDEDEMDIDIESETL